MPSLDRLLLGSAISFVEEEVMDVLELEHLLDGTKNLDYFAQKGILQYTSKTSAKFTFVGAIVANRRVAYVNPKYARSQADTLIFDNSYYIKVIRKYVEYSTGKSVRKPVQDYLDDISLLMRTFDNLDIYYQRYGAFKEQSSGFRRGDHGRVNWAKTLQNVVPVHVTGDPDGGIGRLTSTPSASSYIGGHMTATEAVFYPSPIHHTTAQDEGIISLIFKQVLTILASIISPLLARPHPLSLRLNQDAITSLFVSLAERRPFYARVVAQQIPKEFGPRRTVLSSLLAFLRAEASVLDGAIRNRTFAFGVRNFSSVWEDACIHAVGGERGSHQLAKIIWRPSQGGRGEYQSRIDAKISTGKNKRTTLIDAKYYLLDTNSKDSSTYIEKIIPQYDVVKQFGYMLAYHLGSGCELTSIDSAFITPRVSNTNISYLGQISFENAVDRDDTGVTVIRPISVFGVNPQYIFDAYVIGKKLAELITFIGVNHEYVQKTARITKKKIDYKVVMRKDEEGLRIIGSEGQTVIPLLGLLEINKALTGVKDKTIIRIFTDMRRNLAHRNEMGYIVSTDEPIQNYETAETLLCGSNRKLRRSVHFTDDR